MLRLAKLHARERNREERYGRRESGREGGRIIEIPTLLKEEIITIY